MRVGEFKKILEEYPDDMWLEFHLENENREVYSYTNGRAYSHMGTRCIVKLKPMGDKSINNEFPMLYDEV